MTTPNNYEPLSTACNGVTTNFAISWPFVATSHVIVMLYQADGTALSPAPVLNGAGTYDYTITGTPDTDLGIYPSGTIVFNNAPSSSYTCKRWRQTPAAQAKELPSNGRFPAKSVEGGIDLLTLLVQEIKEAISRVLRIRCADGAIIELPPLAGGAKKALVVNAAGTAIVYSDVLTIEGFPTWMRSTREVIGEHTVTGADPCHIRFDTTGGIDGVCIIARDLNVDLDGAIIIAPEYCIEIKGGGIVEIRDDAGATIDTFGGSPKTANQMPHRWVQPDGTAVWSKIP